ncbi:MAG: MBL fold metallo-hydrolase [Bacteroidales bacterium]|jgi:phosphoribosyl 1,2-cyclic phosphate phosphodiesterase|nr:MBL fold metallo-hydrolase [Bacteroidales bacterium]
MKELIFLGTGTSQGLPIIGCDCEVCRSANTHDKRLRTSALLCSDNMQVVIDAGPDFRQQMLRENVRDLSAVLLTHHHHDHTGGLDDIRPYNHFLQRTMPVYGSAETLRRVKQNYSYAFDTLEPYPGAPQFSLQEVNGGFTVGDFEFLPIEVLHGGTLKVTAYRTGDLVYITDAKTISETSFEKMKGVRTLVINALRIEPHPSHFCLQEALEIVDFLKPERTFLTHISHRLGLAAELPSILPAGVSAAYDGLKVEL